MGAAGAVLGGGPAAAEEGGAGGEDQRPGQRKAARRGTKGRAANNSVRKWPYERNREREHG